MAKIPIGINEADGKYFYSLKELYTDEDPWIRYVRTDGNDANDGKTDAAGGAWLTFNHALAMKARIHSFALIKAGAGTYNEALDIKSGLGMFAIVGSFTEVYASVTCTGYVRYGVNSLEKWTEMTLNVAGEPTFAWNATLKDMYVEYADNTGKIWRQKIIYYDQANLRIFMIGGAPSAVGGTPFSIKFVTVGTIIRNTSTTYKQPMIINSNYSAIYDKSPAWDSPRDGVFLHAIKLVDTTATTDSFALNVAVGATARFGIVELSADGPYELSNLGVCNSIFFGSFFFTAAMNAIIDPRTGTTPGTNGGIVTFIKQGLMNYGVFDVNAIVCQATAGYISNQDPFLSSPPRIYLFDFYNVGSVMIKCGELEVYRRCNLGQYLRARGGINYANSPVHISISSSVSGKVTCQGAPDVTYGRIYLDKNTNMELFNGLDLGDCSAFATAVPLLSVLNGSFITTKAVDIGSAGKEIVVASQLVKFDAQSKAIFGGDLTIYHGSNATQPNAPTITIDKGSEVLFTAGKPNIIAKTAPFNRGLIEITGDSLLHLADQTATLTIVHSVGVDPNFADVIRVLKSKFISEGSIDITSTFKGSAIYTANGNVILEAAATFAHPNGVIYTAIGEMATMKTGPTTIASCKAGTMISAIENAVIRSVGNIVAPSQDYGANPIILIDKSAKFIAEISITDGVVGVSNWNTNAQGRGWDIRRASTVILNGPFGFSGTAGDMVLGGLGIGAPAAYPGAGTSRNDIVNGTENVAELASIHCY